MRKLSKILAVVLAAVMTLALGISAFAYDITITRDPSDTADHTYEVYQIFTGDLFEETKDGVTTKTLSNIEWGTGIDASKSKAELAAKLNDYASLTGDDALTATSTARAFAEAIALVTDQAKVEVIAEELEKLLSSTCVVAAANGTDKYIATDLAAGYYLVKDKDGSLDGKTDAAYTKYILQVLSNVDVTEKGSVPSVEKFVDGNKKVADYEMFETIPFTVTATIPSDVGLKDYEEYYVSFADIWSNGLTFDQIDSVTITANGFSKTLSVEEYAFSKTDNSFTLTIADILPLLEEQVVYANSEVKITVNYTAHLNENAVSYNTNQDAAADNYNDVQMTYSNNPNVDKGGKGITPKDRNIIFTYKVDNTKYAEEAKAGNEMEGAGFTLFEAGGETPVALIWDEGKKAYRPATEAEQAAEGYTAEITSKADGNFNIIGLDEGTYVLKETTTPAGYNTCEDITIVIAADIQINSDGTTGKLVIEADSENLNNDVINKKGSVLPSTGGIGTTIFYIVGIALVLGAGIALVAKRKMRANG